MVILLIYVAGFSGTVRAVLAKENTKPVEVMATTEVSVVQGPEVCTPQPQMVKQKVDPQLLTGLKKTQTAKKIASLLYVREGAAPAPFISITKMVRKFESSTRDSSILHVNATSKPKLTLMRPKEPDLEASHCAQYVRVKSCAELEEEMMANIPKFKARPVNKKMLEASTLPALPRSTPQLPEFQEFHLKTTERANQNVETSSIESSYRSFDNEKASPGKIFIGGLAKDTTLATFTNYFEKYGGITDSVIIKDQYTGHPRGFGFITYADPSVVDIVIEETHVINGKQVCLFFPFFPPVIATY
ncbi:hypothetical protein IFM89_033363 [Coptis chinensis]|uniref:RRM domain-containing protein n=1 Tax=Coptis chinensis TaxID=261450 RepID=A0A835LKJ7_9MAGN|nr:hypothetical protein IFM89_033363 [Coptis chinensis]